MKSRPIQKFFFIFLIVFTIVLLTYATIITNTIKNNKDILEYQNIQITEEDKIYQYLKANINYNHLEIDKSNLKSSIEDLIEFKFYNYIGKNSSSIANGKGLAYVNFHFRYIVIAENISTRDYITTLTHELIHLKYYNANEMWTNFMTFKLLYESNNSVFKQAAINFAYRYISSHTLDSQGNLLNNNVAQEDYDIAYYVISYFNSQNAS